MICGAQYDLKSEIKQHYESHRQNGVFQCTQCSVCTPNIKKLKAHLRDGHVEATLVLSREML